MATHIMELKCGGTIYYISHSGIDVYFSTSGRGVGTSKIKGVKFSNNQIIDSNNSKPVTEPQLCIKINQN